jgi:predicted nucleic acid-binding protein
MKVILIDSSVWIDFLRHKSDLAGEVGSLLQMGSAALCPVTWFELFRGLKGRREIAALDELKALSLWLEIDPAVWLEANEIGRKAEQHGLNCPVADVLIVACAKRHGAAVLHRDKHIAALLEL